MQQPPRLGGKSRATDEKPHRKGDRATSVNLQVRVEWLRDCNQLMWPCVVGEPGSLGQFYPLVQFSDQSCKRATVAQPEV